MIKHDEARKKFQSILKELDAVFNDLNQVGSDVFKKGNYSEATKLSDIGKNLKAIKDQLISLHNKRRKDPGTIKSPNTNIRVEFQNGKIIHKKSAAEGFAYTLKEFGFEKVRELGIKIYNIPLIDIKKDSKYNQTFVNSFYILTHTNNRKKVEILEEVSKRLGVKINVFII